MMKPLLLLKSLLGTLRSLDLLLEPDVGLAYKEGYLSSIKIDGQ